MFMPNWSAKVEYLYYDLGDNNLAINNTASGLVTGAAAPLNALTPFTSTNIQGHTTGNLVRAGVNYHLSLSPSAIVAKY
jgi:outer membrane immunogenic protein